jgi:hypothetical protein
MTVQICEKDWTDITEEIGGRVFAQISFGERKIVCSVGSPVQQDDITRGAVFMPTWIGDRLGIDLTGDEVAVTFLGRDAFVEATKIVLRPHDSLFYNVQEVKENLEGALTRLGVVERGQAVLLFIPELGHELAFDVVGTEPASVVLCEGDEVAIEFEEAVDSLMPPAAPAVIPAVADAPMFPDEEVAYKPEGHVLGGTRRENPWRVKGFVPPYSRNDESPGKSRTRE